jgi:phosphinothricin acetyltransferase
MNIRTATPNDAVGICAVWNPLIEQSATTFTTALKTKDGIAADIAARGGAFFVFERAGIILGFATYFPFRGGPGYARTKEHSINLAPEARGSGAGLALMQALEAHARDAKIHSLWAGIGAENPQGVSFHERLGFAHIACLHEVGFKFGRWMDLVLMQKILD